MPSLADEGGQIVTSVKNQTQISGGSGMLHQGQEHGQQRAHTGGAEAALRAAQGGADAGSGIGIAQQFRTLQVLTLSPG